MCTYSADGGLASDWHLVHLGQFALGGAGAVFTEAAAVEPRGRITPEANHILPAAERRPAGDPDRPCGAQGEHAAPLAWQRAAR